MRVIKIQAWGEGQKCNWMMFTRMLQFKSKEPEWTDAAIE